jgi:hypothetical protein
VFYSWIARNLMFGLGAFASSQRWSSFMVPSHFRKITFRPVLNSVKDKARAAVEEWWARQRT